MKDEGRRELERKGGRRKEEEWFIDTKLKPTRKQSK